MHLFTGLVLLAGSAALATAFARHLLAQRPASVPVAAYPPFLLAEHARFLRENGRVREAAALLEEGLAKKTPPLLLINAAVEMLVSAGLYSAALRAGQLDNKHDPSQLNRLLIQINLAEAEYNLGQWDAASARLEDLGESCKAFPVTHAGLYLQRAWIAAHLGRGEEALDLCEQVEAGWLPDEYQAEYYFTCCAAFLSLGRLDQAAEMADEGTRVAFRSSSKRNALFLSARIAVERKDWNAAEQLCRRASEHEFKGQGGDGLLLWGNILKELGRDEEAKLAWRLAAERDPESEPARQALLNLAE